VEHDADGVWWNDFVHLARELLNQSRVLPQDVLSVGCSGIGPCVLPTDGEGQPLRPAILYGADTRAMEEVEELNRTLGPEWLMREAGTLLSAQSAGPKILWIRRHEPDIWRRTRRVMTSTSYLVYRLTGQVVIDHYTATAYAPLYNLHSNTWDPRGLDPICPVDLLPSLGWSTAVAGHVNSDAAAETGLAFGTPVIVGTCDAASEAVAAGVVSPGDIMLMYGSTMFFIQIVGSLPRSSVLWPAVFLEPGTHALAAGMATTGSLTRWFRDQFGAPETTLEEQGGPNAYSALAHLASQVAVGSEGLLVLPYFSGARTPINDPLARGMIAGLTLSHTRGHVYRAILEGIAYGVRHNLEAMTESDAPPRRLVAIGGGTKNPLWLQIVSDVTGRTQSVRSSPGASYGNAFLAGVGVKALDGVASIQSWLSEPDVVVPDPAAHAFYDRHYSLYRALYESTREVTHTLARVGGLDTVDNRNESRGFGVND
jgi:xylulokinase